MHMPLKYLVTSNNVGQFHKTKYQYMVIIKVHYSKHVLKWNKLTVLRQHPSKITTVGFNQSHHTGVRDLACTIHSLIDL